MFGGARTASCDDAHLNIFPLELPSASADSREILVRRKGDNSFEVRNLLVGNVPTADHTNNAVSDETFQVARPERQARHHAHRRHFLQQLRRSSPCTISATRLNSSSPPCLSGNVSRRDAAADVPGRESRSPPTPPSTMVWFGRDKPNP